MLLGVPVQDFISVFGDIPMSSYDVYNALNKCRFWWNALLFEYFVFNGHYLASVPSLNFEGGGHYIIVRKDDFGMTIFDPNMGRPGRKFYGDEKDGGVPLRWKCELIYVCKQGWGGNWYNGYLPKKK